MSKENGGIKEFETEQLVETMTDILKDPTKGKGYKKTLFKTLVELENSGEILKGIVVGLWGVGEQGKEITVKSIEVHKVTIEEFLKRLNDKDNQTNEKVLSGI